MCYFYFRSLLYDFRYEENICGSILYLIFYLILKYKELIWNYLWKFVYINDFFKRWNIILLKYFMKKYFKMIYENLFSLNDMFFRKKNLNKNRVWDEKENVGLGLLVKLLIYPLT